MYRRRMYRSLVLATAALTFVVVVVGAYVRLSDAGLGCPDWPGCYGALTPHNARDEIAQAVAGQGGTHGPVSLTKAWKEMGHRYIAGLLGVAIALVAALARGMRGTLGQSPLLATALALLVIVQATLGMWTVTLLLKPVIVTLHLLGGMTILALLTWLALRQFDPAPAPPKSAIAALRRPARLALVLVALQIAVGGWVSSNYAALACADLPTCRGEWVPAMDFGNAFHVLRELGMTAEGQLLSNDALTAIHFMHRVGGVLVLAAMLYLAWRLVRTPPFARLGWLAAVAVCTQFALGILTVLLSLPLPLAAAHNAGAAALVVVIVVINFRLRAPAPASLSR
jgi:cytochrome c oxidase assembly protein subunit 15